MRLLKYSSPHRVPSKGFGLCPKSLPPFLGFAWRDTRPSDPAPRRGKVVQASTAIPEGVEEDDRLSGWIQRAAKFVGTMRSGR